MLLKLFLIKFPCVWSQVMCYLINISWVCLTCICRTGCTEHTDRCWFLQKSNAVGGGSFCLLCRVARWLQLLPRMWDPDNFLTLLLGLVPHTSFLGECHNLVWISVSRPLIVVVYFIGPYWYADPVLRYLTIWMCSIWYILCITCHVGQNFNSWIIIPELTATF